MILNQLLMRLRWKAHCMSIHMQLLRPSHTRLLKIFYNQIFLPQYSLNFPQ
jgi:hypothetical protein